ncbi:MAG: hypothetical protein JXA81_12460, partial [Sedimentisphaerales bacterium]|nr:hypothetical protein [Sedimentisphaerales bacterium]
DEMERKKAEKRWYELLLPGISRLLPSFLLYIRGNNFKEKKKIFYTHDLNVAIICYSTQRTYPASTAIEASGVTRKLVK